MFNLKKRIKKAMSQEKKLPIGIDGVMYYVDKTVWDFIDKIIIRNTKEEHERCDGNIKKCSWCKDEIERLRGELELKETFFQKTYTIYVGDKPFLVPDGFDHLKELAKVSESINCENKKLKKEIEYLRIKLNMPDDEITVYYSLHKGRVVYTRNGKYVAVLPKMQVAKICEEMSILINEQEW